MDLSAEVAHHTVDYAFDGLAIHIRMQREGQHLLGNLIRNGHVSVTAVKELGMPVHRNEMDSNVNTNGPQMADQCFPVMSWNAQAVNERRNVLEIGKGRADTRNIAKGIAVCIADLLSGTDKFFNAIDLGEPDTCHDIG